jgi:putative phosphoesterase
VKIGIISDTHGSVTAWQLACANCFTDTDLIVHCGDILYHGPRNPLPEGHNPSALAQQLNSYSKPIIFAKGNCDADVDQLLIDLPIEAPYTHLITPDYRILIHHGHQFSETNIPVKTKSHYKISISGHTHIRRCETIDGMVFINPGSPALPKNEDNIPTVAVLEGYEVKFLNILNGNIVASYKFS